MANRGYIPDAGLNNAQGVWLFTGDPAVDNTAFAHTSGSSSVPPYPTSAASKAQKSHPYGLPAVVVCPGGGYEMLSTYSEGVQLAQRMERDGGYKAFVLNNRIAPNYYPLPQMDLALAIMHVRAHAAEYGINPSQIAVVGSSAGGHLCASEALLYQELAPKVLEELKKQGAGTQQIQKVLEQYQAVSARPDALGLLYPVVSFQSEYHEGSYLNLTNGQPGLREKLSVESHITSDYPPVYAFANADDTCVPVSNTTRLDTALAQAGVPHVCEVFPTGDHGVGLGYGCSCQEWSEHMLAFLEGVFA